MKKPRKNFRSLELNTKNAISNFGSGIHRSYLLGGAGDVDIVREYQPGDKRLDCRSSLRVGKVMSRVFNPEKVISVLIVLDASQSGFYGLDNLKIEAGIAASLYLTFLAGEANDFIGLITFGGGVENFIELSSDAENITSVLETLYDEFAPSENGGNLESALQKIVSLQLSNCLLVVVSDFLFPISQKVTGFLERFSAGTNNSALALVLVNSNEWILPKANFIAEIVDSESNERAMISLKSAKKAKKYNEALIAWKEDIQKCLHYSGCQPIFMDVNESDVLLPLIKHFLKTQT